MTKEYIHFIFQKDDDWFDIKSLIDFKKGCDIKKFVQDETHSVRRSEEL